MTGRRWRGAVLFVATVLLGIVMAVLPPDASLTVGGILIGVVLVGIIVTGIRLRAAERHARVGDLVRSLGETKRVDEAPRTGTALRAAAIVAGAVVAYAVWAGTYGLRDPMWAYNLLPLHAAGGGLAWFTAGVVLTARPRSRRLAVLLLLTGMSIWLTRLIDSSNAVLFTIGLNLQWLTVVLAPLTLLAYPDGRLRSRVDRVVIAVLATTVAGHALAGVIYEPTLSWCQDCPEGLNLLLVRPMHELLDTLYEIAVAVYALGWTYTTVALVRHYRLASPAARRVRGAMLVPAVNYFGIGALFFAYDFSLNLGVVVPPIPLAHVGMIAWVAQLALPVAFLIGLVRARAQRGRVAELVADLPQARTTDRLESALRATLGDPSLVVAYWAEQRGRYETADGTPVGMPDADATRAATKLDDDGQPLAVLVHDAALLDDPRLLEASAAAAKLAIENAQLAAQLRAQLEEVRASRARIVAAADEARRRVERDLHDGAQQRLVSLALVLRRIRTEANREAPGMGAAVDVAIDELDAALRELRELARGVYPQALAEGGLSAAFDVLAERARIPASVDAVPDERLPAPVETAAYFVASEALTNAAKHAPNARVRLRAVRENGCLLVEVSDDGGGGARLQEGGGLRGLVDRVEALGGRLTVVSTPAEGTTVRAELPCASS